jgi:hypothetical protein
MGDEQLLKRKKLSFAEIIQVIESRKTNNSTIQNLADQFKCSTFQIKTILSQREYYLKKQLKTIVRPLTVASPTVQLATTCDESLLVTCDESRLATCDESRIVTCATPTTSTFIHQSSTTTAKSNFQLRRASISLSLEDKIQIILSRNSNNTVQNLADKYKCTKSQIQSILSQREHYLKQHSRLEQNATTGQSTTTGKFGKTTTAISNKQRTMKTYKTLTLAEKIQVIESRKTLNTSMRKLANQFDCGRNQISLILLHQDEYLKEYEENQLDLNSNIKARKKRPYLMTKEEKEDLHQKVLEWYTKQCNMGIAVNGLMIQQEARKINPKFGASHDWLIRFKRLYNICTTYQSEDDNDDASIEDRLPSSQMGIPRADSDTQLSDSQLTDIFNQPQSTTTLMLPCLNNIKNLADIDITKGGLVPSQLTFCRFNEILFEPLQVEVRFSYINLILHFLIFY